MALGVAISVYFLFDEIEAVVAFFGPTLGAVFAAWSWIWDGIKKVNTTIKMDIVEKVSQIQVDVEIGQGASLSSALKTTSNDMRKLKSEIDVIKDRFSVAHGESLGNQGAMVISLE